MFSESAPKPLLPSAPRTTQDAVIRVRNLSKSFPIYAKPSDRLKQFIYPKLRRLFGLQPKQYYRTFDALKDISFEIKRGETVGIIGRNGAGKSTLLQILCGTLTPTSGEVEVSGRIAALLELGAGFNGEYTGRENVYMNARILGLTDSEINRRFDEIIAFADIGEHLDQPVKTYSSGMFVRLAFSVVVNVSADVLIVDEALAVGDAFFQAKCMRRLKDFSAGGGTILFVSHDIGSVKALCSKAIWLSCGKLNAHGSSADIATAYARDWVNHSNSEATVAQAKQPAYPSKDRQDSFRFLEVQVFDPKKNTPSLHFVYGDQVQLNLIAKAFRPVQNLIVSVHIKNRFQQHLIGLNTGLQSDLYLRGLDENHQSFISFTVPVCLQHGSYTITAVASTLKDARSYSDVCFLDWSEDIASFNVGQRELLPLSDLIEICNEPTIRISKVSI